MFDEWLRELTEVSEEEMKSTEALQSVAEYNQLGFGGAMVLLSNFQGFDDSIIAEKVNPLATPFILNALH